MTTHTGGWIVVTLATGSASHRCEIDGTRVLLTGRQTALPVAPGLHRVTCWYVYYGGALEKLDLMVNVPPGGTVPVFYAMPMHMLGKASLSFHPQPRSWAFSGREVREQLLVLAALVGAVLCCGVGVGVWRYLTG